MEDSVAERIRAATADCLAAIGAVTAQARSGGEDRPLPSQGTSAAVLAGTQTRRLLHRAG